MTTKLPKTQGARQRALIEVLREKPPGEKPPPLPDFAAERAMLPERAREPGVRVVHILDEPREWRIQPLVDRQPVGKVISVRRKRDVDAAVDRALEEARKLILQSGHPLADTVHAKKAWARRA